MAIATPPDPAPKPRGLTLADLMVLTLGVAVVSSLTWYSGSPNSTRINGRPAPGWYVAGNHGIEACQKACIALGVFILFRRWRDGGPIRPAEALPMFVGLPDLIFAVSKWRRLGMYYPSPDDPNLVLVNEGVMYAWFLAQMALGLVAAVVATRGRRLPPWVAGALFVFAYSRLNELGGWSYQEWANQRLRALNLSWIQGMLVSRGLVQWPQTWFMLVPAGAAVVDFSRRDRPERRSWTERAGLALGVALYLMVPVRYYAQDRLRPSSSSSLPMLTVYVAAILAALLLARATAPAWRRCLGERRGGPAPIIGGSPASSG